MKSVIYILLIATLYSSISLKKVTIYTESYCPDCIDFEQGNYSNYMLNPSKEDLCEIEFIVFGNAEELPDSKLNERKFKCQHGDIECYGNIVSNCAQKYLSLNNFDDFLICSGENILEQKDFNYSINKCILDNDVKNYIINCSNSDEGKELLHIAGLNTKKHDHVPYILVDNEYDIQLENSALKNFNNFICELTDSIGKVDGCGKESHLKINNLLFLNDENRN